jgi:tryptophanyl-tRNA synthetase
MQRVILTGLRANGQLHIGNYLGAIAPMVNVLNSIKDEDQVYIFVADLHSFTTAIEHQVLNNQILQNTKYYLAAGLDSNRENFCIFRQSYVPAHSELTWILSCFTGVGEISGMIQFKEKTKQNQTASAGLLEYPILMSSDILLYDAEYVPVGEDQEQHIEYCRDISTRINNKFVDIYPNGVLVVPKNVKEQQNFFGNLDEGVRIRSLSNPEKKMSKSITDPKGTIGLEDLPSEAAKKVMSATTDSFANIAWDWTSQSGITNLLQLDAQLNQKSREQVLFEWQGKSSYGDLKKQVANSVEKFLTSFQAKLADLKDEEVFKVLENGEKQANLKANQTLNRVQVAVGIRSK